jgi:hypothetical protein
MYCREQKMDAVVFPYTLLSESDVHAVEMYLPRPIFFLPSQHAVDPPLTALAESGRVRLRTPFTGDEARIAGALAAYRKWLSEHAKSETAALYTARNVIPFFDERTPSRIRAQIRGTLPEAPHEDRLAASRIFLHAAQEYDRQQLQLDRDLSQLRKQERALFTSLAGDENINDTALTPPSPGPEPSDAGGFMTSARLSAWATLYVAARGNIHEPDVVFITTRSAVIDTVSDALPELRRLGRFAPAPVEGPDEEAPSFRQERFFSWVKECRTVRPEPLSGDRAEPDNTCVPPHLPSFTLYRIAGLGPVGVFSRLSGASGDVRPDGDVGGYTDIGLILNKDAPGR